MDKQNIYVTQTNTNQGCFGGCGTAFAVVLLVGIAIQYWYVSLALAVVGSGIGLWYYRTQQNELSRRERHAVASPLSGPHSCENCGHPVTGNFCAHCGTAQNRTCAHCGKTGLSSPYCPDCGAATFAPPAPN